MRVMEVAFYESDQTSIDFIIEPDWTLWVTDFFIEGGLDIPPEINKTKPLKDLTEKDYKLFFEELGWDVLGFETYDPEVHKKYTFDNIDTKENPFAES